MRIEPYLIQKYNKPGPRYTSYPPATFFSESFDGDAYLKHLRQSNSSSPRNVSFYFHVPFCRQLCHFCGCNTGAMRDKNTIRDYFEAMKKEFLFVTKQIDQTRPITQVHWGGGTPNAVPTEFVGEIMELVNNHFPLAEGCEIAMECNPAYLSFSQIDEFAAMGFNRISIGIQDFDPHVLKLINRKPSDLPEEDLVKYLQSKKIGVNLDFVYGLPGQTPESFEATIRRAAEMKPERLVTFSYAHVPWVKSAQRILEQYKIPESDEKMAMLEKAYDVVMQQGYDAVGFDHFALPSDEMAIALKNKQLHRNFMGYCTQNNTGQVYAFGSTSISQLSGAFAQNVKDTHLYIERINQTGIATEKGYELTERDKLCSSIIHEIMCNNYLNLNEIAKEYHISLSELKRIINFDDQALLPFIEDSLAEFEDDKLTILPKGRFFLRNVAMLFDPLLTESKMKYSKTV